MPFSSTRVSHFSCDLGIVSACEISQVHLGFCDRLVQRSICWTTCLSAYPRICLSANLCSSQSCKTCSMWTQSKYGRLVNRFTKMQIWSVIIIVNHQGKKITSHTTTWNCFPLACTTSSSDYLTPCAPYGGLQSPPEGGYLHHCRVRSSSYVIHQRLLWKNRRPQVKHGRWVRHTYQYQPSDLTNCLKGSQNS